MKLRYRLVKLGVEVTLEYDSPNVAAPIVVTGVDEDLTQIARQTLTRCRGAFGHLLGEGSASAIDLDAAMRTPEIQAFRPQLIEGTVPQYDAQIPGEAKT